MSRIWTRNFDGDRYSTDLIGSCKSNYHMITATMGEHKINIDIHDYMLKIWEIVFSYTTNNW